ncbi:MAG TPA: isopentenyl-diphosphate Delta-isomerase [Candidatus Saccharimonadales bacterium]|nr:isopentenyl-diphosphate Delta-isomerase [Candidatus Saccharimonadales bacterium]
MEEHVILVNEQNEVIGTAEKLKTHNHQTPLHRGISVFLFDTKGNLLLQQRSSKKKTWPLVWSNSCCGHPKLDETSIETAKRRLSYELGITDAELTVALPDYRYKFDKDGIYENEFCPVMIGKTNQQPTVNPAEVEAIRWISWEKWLHEIATNPEKYSPWCVEETILLSKNRYFQDFLQEEMRKLPNK